ncbi:uncharacterized protein MYCGRDRAFT_97781 [Zymoseptoria tritici IPO323]|uniref:Uncharacterized protein n=1 Tax=Zymoseptoria tritici (strain CBS 115943 / IPO323) TaxID=336722 RepID=F9XRC9_ZYMTI|nr:uncharacterized protein MYCGRDRAFT_97781 [Zymoseptoria tritici IPO323]EGP82116.1 hypothetical protein MYCGRDRAFT_97781 [Zymoseptoria tritici IPO323]
MNFALPEPSRGTRLSRRIFEQVAEGKTKDEAEQLVSCDRGTYLHTCDRRDRLRFSPSDAFCCDSAQADLPPSRFPPRYLSSPETYDGMTREGLIGVTWHCIINVLAGCAQPNNVFGAG